MKKMGLIMFLFLLLFALSGCGNDKGNSIGKKIQVSKNVSMITLKGNGTAVYSETEKRLIDREIILEETEDIEVIIKAIENSTSHSGPMTSEGENFNLVFTNEDNTSEIIHLWLYSDRASRIQKANDEVIQILNKEDAQNISKILAEKLL
ncbi:hypothetical protein V1503_02605 [Bacillus sp. SCS-151]|uniref:hypothetical protein n=1 Tax=Nanhaiella sioensis TaxID=3115293 RepID=UPI00397C0B10